MTLLQNGLLGAKSGQGFYKTVVDREGRKSFWGLDLQAASEGEVDYLQPGRTTWPSVDAVRNSTLPERLGGLVASHSAGEDGENTGDEAAGLIWHTLSRTLAYASKRVPEIADSPHDIDNAMKWGFGWEMGPFETWDALGVADTTQRIADEGLTVAPWVQEMLGEGHGSFYRSEEASGPGASAAPMQVYNPQTGRYESVDDGDQVVSISALKRGRGVLAGNSAASLLDMGRRGAAPRVSYQDERPGP